MSTNPGVIEPEPSGFPELTELGKRLEVLRIERGISKQHLARFAGTSRQQLWRVMTGKSDLTSGLRQRLADALRCESASLATSDSGWAPATLSLAAAHLPPLAIQPNLTLAAYVADVASLERTMRSLPTGETGRKVKRTLLNALEDQAVEQQLTLGASFFDVRRRVLAGEL
jgi:transcriptional regulator with XRE-family HTH domain